MFEYTLKFIAGGTLIAAVSYLSKREDHMIAGLLAVAPIVTLISYIMVGNESGHNVLRSIVGNSILFLPLTFVYLIALYLLLQKTSVNINLSIGIALIIWIVCAVWTSRLKG